MSKPKQYRAKEFLSYPKQFKTEKQAESVAAAWRKKGWIVEVSEGSSIDMTNPAREMPVYYMLLIRGVEI